ncbi:MAG: amidase [Alphaproteobacteria bacterium]|nr:amidase [Alphaproteobacteria bacterium]
MGNRFLSAVASTFFIAAIVNGTEFTPAYAKPYDVEEKSIATLQADLASGATTSEALVAAYLNRIERIDRAGPTLRSVLALNPRALDDARALDVERRAGKTRGPLHGIPILVKDNIETADPVATTAGSLALAANLTGRDAPLIARLRAGGAIILGKTNLSEWANIRSSRSTSGWSAVGGLTRNPYALDRNACGSSSGSGAAAAASLAAATIGTETDGSITCPASINGIVGIKPTIGLVSRTHVVPISRSQDTAGPMARNVADMALLLTLMAGSDSSDPATKDADTRKTDYATALDPNALNGKRIGVLKFLTGYHNATDAAFTRAIDEMKTAGADIVEIEKFPGLDKIGADELPVLLTELKAGLNDYLASTPQAVATRTLEDVIAFNNRSPSETALFGQDLFEQAQLTKGLSDPAYLKIAARIKRQAGREGIDRLLKQHKLDALVAPTGGPAWTTDIVTGDHFLGAASTLPAVAGYPHITVPMGQTSGLPVGISFIGAAWSEAKLISLAYAYEQRSHARKPPQYLRGIEDLETVRAALNPSPH